MKPFAPALISALAIVAQADTIEHRLKLEFDELTAKAGAAIETVNSMEQRARETGFSLNPDLMTQRALVQSSMDDAGEALRLKDFGKLKERLQRSRALIERLFKMM